jgi:hypothetical protein
LDLILWTARDGTFSQQKIEWIREISVDTGISYRNEGMKEIQNESIVLLANKKDSSHAELYQFKQKCDPWLLEIEYSAITYVDK